ncbi:MAG: dTDP-4-dehydrorhamnose reductase [Desulfobulbaceae bacterium]|nr:dTDP-4-dehydrorhamnose reductase [Desulfobulbaceae bacterium]HIJ77972.1 dTDP-4-dehydrorhamnose reductase [Deltaproteobacteria bacterium]
MKVLIVGATGQVGWELQRCIPAGLDVVALGSAELDISNRDDVSRKVAQVKPQVVINAAAYTAVDRAEGEKEKAFAVNETGVGFIAAAAREVDAFFLQVSTDFIFDGESAHPYLPAARPNPLGVYGASKLGGEKKVQELCGDDWAIVRTSWVYSCHGHNFVKTMLRMMAERDFLSVVDDQVGSPTWAHGLAEVLWLVVVKRLPGIMHWSDAGVASWYDFAFAIMEEAVALGILKKKIEIKPIASVEYPLPAKRPAYSVLDKRETWQQLGKRSDHWRVALRQMLMQYKEINCA